MRATIQNYLEAAKARREETGEKGFSLIELIVVVAILGILVAIAIPVFTGIQENARKGALDSAAASGATVAAAAIANGDDATEIGTALTKSSTADYTLALSGTNITLDGFCVTATAKTGGALDSSNTWIGRKGGNSATTCVSSATP